MLLDPLFYQTLKTIYHQQNNLTRGQYIQLAIHLLSIVRFVVFITNKYAIPEFGKYDPLVIAVGLFNLTGYELAVIWFLEVFIMSFDVFLILSDKTKRFWQYTRALIYDAMDIYNNPQNLQAVKDRRFLELIEREHLGRPGNWILLLADRCLPGWFGHNRLVVSAYRFRPRISPLVSLRVKYRHLVMINFVELGYVVTYRLIGKLIILSL